MMAVLRAAAITAAIAAVLAGCGYCPSRQPPHHHRCPPPAASPNPLAWVTT